MVNQFSIEKSIKGEVSIIALAGSLDPQTTSEFQNTVQAEVDAKRFKIVVDCENLSFISSSGIGVLLSFLEEARENGGDIKLCRVGKKTKDLFDLISFTQIEIFNDEAEAVRSFDVKRKDEPASSPSRTSKRFPASLDSLSAVRELVVDVAKQAGLNEGEVHKVELAVTEGYTNVVEHSYDYDQKQEQEIVVRTSFDDATLQIEIADTGRGFDASSYKGKNIEQLLKERKSGGLGVHIMRLLMDEVHYKALSGGRNELIMIKKLNK